MDGFPHNNTSYLKSFSFTAFIHSFFLRITIRQTELNITAVGYVLAQHRHKLVNDFIDVAEPDVGQLSNHFTFEIERASLRTALS